MSAKDGSDLARDVNRLHRWAEHFAEVNCGVNVSEAALEGLPVIVPCLCPENVSTKQRGTKLRASLSKDKIAVAISQLRNGGTMGLDKVS